MNYELLPETPSQTAGPYVHIGLAGAAAGNPTRDQEIWNEMARDDAQGEHIILIGKVVDGNGHLIRDSYLELWQANHEGVYDTAYDLEKSFNGFARTATTFDAGEWNPRAGGDTLGETAKSFGAKGLAWVKITAEGQLESVIAKFLDAKALAAALPEAKSGDLVLFGADKPAIVHDVLGRIRLLLGEELNLIDRTAWKPLWVTEFPLLDYSPEEKRYIFMHNPFAAPMDEDMALLDSEPLKARAKAYDMVLNGNEIGG